MTERGDCNGMDCIFTPGVTTKNARAKATTETDSGGESLR
jgi:hypothetical protein